MKESAFFVGAGLVPARRAATEERRVPTDGAQDPPLRKLQARNPLKAHTGTIGRAPHMRGHGHRNAPADRVETRANITLPRGPWAAFSRQSSCNSSSSSFIS